MTGLVFPASAGINPNFMTSGGDAERVPRVSGDKPLLIANPSSGLMCSPRQRG